MDTPKVGLKVIASFSFRDGIRGTKRKEMN